MTDQEQTPLDLAEGERLLAAYKDSLAEEREGREFAWGQLLGDRKWRLEKWLFDNGEALVTALKAVTQKNTELSGIIVEAAKASPDGLVFAVLEQALKREIEQLQAGLGGAHRVQGEMATDIRSLAHQLEDARDDLARVEAEAMQFREERDWETDKRSRAEARIAELEALVAERHPELAYAKADVDGMVQRIAELEGSLRFYAENNGAGSGTARAVLDKAQTPAAS